MIGVDLVSVFEEEMRLTQEEILKAREDRGKKLEQREADYPGHTMVNFKLNIPGDIKTGSKIICLFNYGFNATLRVLQKMASTALVEREYENYGPEGLIITNVKAEDVKKAMINLEDGSEEGRLYDIDVYFDGKQISREDLGYEKRKCLICDKDGVECSRAGSHEMEDVLAKVSEIIEKTVC